jgi:hypothetical protein
VIKKVLISILIFSVFITLFFVFADYERLITIQKGNIEKKPLEIIPYKMQDADCGMVIEGLKFTSQVVSNEGFTWFFHDIGGMINWIERKSFKTKPVIWVYTLDTKRYINGYKAYYSINEDTPMQYGFGAYENIQKHLIEFDDMKLRMLRGENLTNPIVRQKILKGL